MALGNKIKNEGLCSKRGMEIKVVKEQEYGFSSNWLLKALLNEHLMTGACTTVYSMPSFLSCDWYKRVEARSTYNHQSFIYVCCHVGLSYQSDSLRQRFDWCSIHIRWDALKFVSKMRYIMIVHCFHSSRTSSLRQPTQRTLLLLGLPQLNWLLNQ